MPSIGQRQWKFTENQILVVTVDDPKIPFAKGAEVIVMPPYVANKIQLVKEIQFTKQKWSMFEHWIVVMNACLKIDSTNKDTSKFATSDDFVTVKIKKMAKYHENVGMLDKEHPVPFGHEVNIPCKFWRSTGVDCKLNQFVNLNLIKYLQNLTLMQNQIG